MFIINMATAILPSSTIFGTDFWVLTEILRGMMPKIPTGWLARTVKLNGVLPIAALCLICKTEGPILRVGPRRQSRAPERAAGDSREAEAARAAIDRGETDIGCVQFVDSAAIARAGRHDDAAGLDGSSVIECDGVGRTDALEGGSRSRDRDAGR